MKILYVKQNSERAREFQLKTIIYTINGEKFVKKQAMTTEAIPHLKKMKESHKKLSESILNPAIKLAKIIDESDDSLTFEFIEGLSLESKYNQAKKDGNSEEIIDTYMTLISDGFKTLPFDSNSMVTDDFKETLGDFDYSEFDGDLCFEGISNIDLIFSNILYKGENIYLIDYEWVYDFNIPINFSAFRALHDFNDLHWKMEKHFVFERVVGKTGFLNLQKQYSHNRITVDEDMKRMNAHVDNLDLVIADKESIIEDKNVHIKSQKASLVAHSNLSESLHSIITDKETHINTQSNTIQKLIVSNTLQVEQLHGDIEHWHNIARTMTIKGRVKKILKKVLPLSLIEKIKQLKNNDKLSSVEIIYSDTVTPTRDSYFYKEPTLSSVIESEIKNFKIQPLISIIMPVYNVEPKWLKLAIDSIEAQWYTHWELCIADDKSTNEETLSFLKSLNHPQIKITFMEKNLNISGASNAALKLTSGDYIVLMDNDDEITPNALYEMIKTVNVTGAEFIYSDEDKIEMDGTFSDPNFKPDFAADMFLSQNYLSHLGMIKKTLISKVGGFTLGLEGSQDFDLYLKVLEHTDKIYHISKVLYHWRKIPGSTASEYGEKSYAQEAGRKALQTAMQRRDIDAIVKNGQTPGTYKVDYTIKSNPLISIIIPFKDKPDLLKTCIESILEKSTYENFEIIGISNNSNEKATKNEMARLSKLDKRIIFHAYNVPFNYSAINNYAVNTYAKGEHILFLNNDIEIITPTWIEEMLMYSQHPENGAIGAKLYFPNNTIQHAGIVIAPKTIHAAILLYQGFPKEHYGYGSRARCVNNYSAVTAACLMLKRTLFDEINGFDEERLTIAYNDVDLCLRLYEKGYKNIWTPYCEAYHHESLSRGYEESRESIERREKEKWHLKNKHQKLFSTNDPFYNKKLTRFGVGSELDESVTLTHESTTGIPFYEEIIISQKIRAKRKNNVCIFNHFDAENEIKADVLFYLEKMASFTDIIFVSTAEGLNQKSLDTIKVYCRDIIVKKNIGYDFGAWKTGLDYLDNELNDYAQLILCNDSVYGPLFDLESIFDKMRSNDVWAMTDNHEITYHLQSYFMVYTKKAFTHDIVKTFWKNLKIYPNKQMLIENNEINYSQQLINSNLTCNAYYSCKNKNYVNVLHYYWQELILDYEFPFIKKELLKRNPLQLDISLWEDVIESKSNYNILLITETLNT